MQHIVTPMMRLQDPEQTKVLIVTLAEPTPVLEAASLQADLERAGIHTYAWIVNNSLQGQDIHSPILRKRAEAEKNQLHAVRDQHAARLAIVPIQQTEPVGIVCLEKLSQA
jgi:arsenite-transporting ATPase